MEDNNTSNIMYDSDSDLFLNVNIREIGINVTTCCGILLSTKEKMNILRFHMLNYTSEITELFFSGKARVTRVDFRSNVNDWKVSSVEGNKVITFDDWHSISKIFFSDNISLDNISVPGIPLINLYPKNSIKCIQFRDKLFFVKKLIYIGNPDIKRILFN